MSAFFYFCAVNIGKSVPLGTQLNTKGRAFKGILKLLFGILCLCFNVQKTPCGVTRSLNRTYKTDQITREIGERRCKAYIGKWS